jgi:translocation and assembly module TamB
VKFKGDYPLFSDEIPRPDASANLQAVGFSIGSLARASGIDGVASKLDGLAALDANILASPPSLAPRVAGRLEVRKLRLGEDFPIGQFQGVLHYTPNSWRLDPIDGTLLGGPANGRIWSEGAGPERDVNFGMDLSNASLSAALAFVPFLSKRVAGNGKLRVSGRLGTTLRLELLALVDRARVFGLPLSELRAPAELTYNAGGNLGTLVVRDATARFGGGQFNMRSQFQFGADPRYRVHLQLTKLDLEGLARATSDARRTASGRISGEVEVDGGNPNDLRQMKGRVDLDLSDASIVELPIFRQIDRFLGASRGGLFEEGNLSGQIANRQLLVNQLVLKGRLVQIHATGTIGFNEELHLDVQINTNQLIPETGLALARLIPGLGATTRRDQALQQVSGFLATRLTKVRVSGTLRSPQVSADPAVVVTQGAAAFFAGVLELPLGLVR